MKVLVSEVGPRDGLQSISTIMPTEAKKRWITALADAGVQEIEVGSFVPAKLLPQLGDTAELVAHARRIPGLTVAVLVPNMKGAEAAVAAGAHKLTIPVSCSETHSLRNVRRSHAQMLDEARCISELIRTLPAAQRPHFEGGLSTAFGCTLEGAVPERRVVELAEALIADPAQVRRLLRAVWGAVGRDRLTGLHLHNTRGLGLANALAALDLGISTLDASQGGLGGCPFAPGASGNIVTEDLVFMLQAMGFETGIDFQSLLAARALLAAALPNEPLYGMVPLAGLPLNFEPTS